MKFKLQDIVEAEWAIHYIRTVDDTDVTFNYHDKESFDRAINLLANEARDQNTRFPDIEIDLSEEEMD